MHIILKRTKKNGNSLFGTLTVNDRNNTIISLQTIENYSARVEAKTYKITKTYSPKFDTNLWVLHHQKRDGIRIHPANYADELAGCIAPALAIIDYEFTQMATSSTLALNILDSALHDKLEYNLEIIDDY